MNPAQQSTEMIPVLTLEEITCLSDGGKPADTLMNLVALIASRFKTDVGSAYLLEPDRSNLVLAATLGLHPRSIGTLRRAYDGLNGFAIGTGRTHLNLEVHDSRDGDALYRVLLDEVIPLYYNRDRDGLPRGWIKRMKRTIRTLGWRFNADRMVMDYTLKCYIPAAGGTSSEVRTQA